MEFLTELSNRNPTLFIYGLMCFIGAVVTGVLIFSSQTEVLGINAWIKPTKFFLSIGIFSWTMGWYLHYLGEGPVVTSYNWVLVVVMSFELIYIILKASAGELSHFNVSTPTNGAMFALMGIAISLLTLFTAYMGILFFTQSFPDLSPAYLWGIRLGLLLFVIFAFEGGMMGSRLSHTVGGPDGEAGLVFLNWSVKYGDLRIAHFVGMHALQILPLIGYYLVSSTRWIFVLALVYTVVAVGVLVQALMGKPLISQ